MKKKAKRREPTARSLAAVPPVDFAVYGPGRPNPFAARVKAEGVDLVHEGPSAASLREIPTLGREAAGRANPYATRIRAEGYELQVGRGRPISGKEVGPTTVKSVRLPAELWKQLEERATSQGVALHALIRAALVELLERRDNRRAR